MACGAEWGWTSCSHHEASLKYLAVPVVVTEFAVGVRLEAWLLLLLLLLVVVVLFGV